MYLPEDPRSVEKYSSAITLSDMEVFIFPELMMSLMLANVMSPLLWQWREDPWFKSLDRLGPYRRIVRTKQFLMDRFTFNLDLDTWGLTTKEAELERFSDFIDESVLARSNALFGYEGDKYYFDIDIRRHFGLDKYSTNVIPYWKTETAEAMSAFRHKPGYPTGAGECVSLAALYAAALFVVAGIPLEKIYMMATPLHSQNFIDIGEGILTNNRRIVTKKMFFNGTELSCKARRALENERVTILAHHTGTIHGLYRKATLPPETYRRFSNALRRFLKTDISFEVLGSFLRQNKKLQKCFQLAHRCFGKSRYIEAEKVFYYEHGSNLHIGSDGQARLLQEIDEDEFYPEPLPGRLVLDEIEHFLKENRVSVDSDCDIEKLSSSLHNCCFDVKEVIVDLLKFCRVEPNLPETGKEWVPSVPIELECGMTREEVVGRLESIRQTSEVADLAFSAYRDLRRAPWKPFLKAAFQRNPVSVAGAAGLDADQVAEKLWMMENESIYDGSRLAQPDEVWNFNRGDGLEKAICFMNILKRRCPDDEILLRGDEKTVCVSRGGCEYTFQTDKQLEVPPEEDFNVT